MDSVIAVLGDSVVPSLALLESNLSNRYVFFYTPENESRAALFSYYCKLIHPEITTEILPIPSISKPSDMAQFALNYSKLLGPSDGIFVTAGAKQTILPFVINAPASKMITLNHSPLTITLHEDSTTKRDWNVNLDLIKILASRGWNHSVHPEIYLQKGDEKLTEITPHFDRNTGKLSFVGESYLRKNGREEEIHVLSKAEKSRIKGFDQITIGSLLRLAEEFGRNGAQYIIRGALRNPNRSVLPSYILHLEKNVLEEEE